MKLNNANKKILSVLLVLIAAIAVISFAYFNTENFANITGNINFGNSLNVVYTFNSTEEVSFMVNPIYVNDADYLDSNIVEENVVLTNNSNYDLTCSYNIYYESVTPFTDSSNNSGQTELSLMGIDENNLNEDINYNLSSTTYGSASNPIYTGYINVSKGATVVHNWHFYLRLYNLNVAQDYNKNFNAKIRFESTGCKESILTADKTDVSIATGKSDTVTLTNENAGTITCESTDSTNITTSLDGNTLTITRRADTTKQKVVCKGSSAGKVVINVAATKNMSTELLSYAHSSLNDGSSGLLSGGASEIITSSEARYIGSNPNNYVYFNCADYSNPTSDTCELWRIMGIYNTTLSDGTTKQLVKLIRSESIGGYSWDYKQNNVGSSSSVYGSNTWSDSQLMYMLNPATSNTYTVSDCDGTNCVKDTSSNILIYLPGAYFNYSLTDKNGNANYGGYPIKIGTSSYTSYSVSLNASKVVGLKNDTTENMIAEATFDVTGYNGTGNVANSYSSSSKTTWVGKVGLMTIEDYVYATSGGSIVKRSDCLTSKIADYTSIEGYWGGYGNNHTYKGICAYTNWLYSITGTAGEWTMTKNTSLDDSTSAEKASSVFFISGSGYVSDNINPEGGKSTYFTTSVKNVRPVLYLTSNVYINGGTGNIKNPYRIVAR